MARQPKLYTRLSRPAFAVGSYNSLWLGPDHLLLLTSTGYTDEYRRILLRDIQGIFLIESARHATWQVIWIAISLIFGFTTIASLLYRSPPYISVVLLALALIALGWNYLMGKGCKVYAITGVQTVQLPSLVRWKKARKVLGRLEPLILAAQKAVVNVPVVMAIPEPPPLPLS